MTDNVGVTTTAPVQAPPAGKRKRGRESVGDMVRSLGLILVIVVVVWFFAQPSPGDSKAVRPVDTTEQFQDFTRLVPGAPLPRILPAGDVPTVAAIEGGVLRIGFNTTGRQYAEVIEGTGPAEPFLVDRSDKGAVVGTVQVAGRPWQLRRSAAGRESLTRAFDQVAVVVGGPRASASLPELSALAGSLSAG
jgi:hypothetical protein